LRKTLLSSLQIGHKKTEVATNLSFAFKSFQQFLHFSTSFSPIIHKIARLDLNHRFGGFDTAPVFYEVMKSIALS